MGSSLIESGGWAVLLTKNWGVVTGRRGAEAGQAKLMHNTNLRSRKSLVMYFIQSPHFTGGKTENLQTPSVPLGRPGAISSLLCASLSLPLKWL